MAESVFAMRLVKLRSVTCYTDQGLNLFTSEKCLNKAIRRLLTLRTWMLTLPVNILNCLLVNEGDEET